MTELDAKALLAAQRVAGAQARIGYVGADGRVGHIPADPMVEKIILAYLNTAHSPAMGWRPIETAPKDGNPFLCGWWNSERSYWYTCKAHWANGAVDGGWDGAREPFAVHPTHWMPLPPPPANEEQR